MGGYSVKIKGISADWDSKNVVCDISTDIKKDPVAQINEADNFF